MTGHFALNPGIDVDALAHAFARDGRVTIDHFLADGQAEALEQYLRGREDWLQVFNSGDKLIELDRKTRASLTPQQLEQLDAAIHQEARTKFQYRYETLRIPDAPEARRELDNPLSHFAQWMSSGEARDFLRRVTGESGIMFADCQATAYSPGDFLTEHTDHVEGKNRYAAYVLSLSPVWSIAWGGLLMMHAHDQRSAQAIVPRAGALNLFRVPQPHSVSMVTPAAPLRRYSITGWLRH